jgi:hypothetical protein
MRKIIRHSITCLALLMTGSALAAVQHSYEVFVDIPAASFYVLPDDAILLVNGLKLVFDRIKSDFEPVSTYFTVLNHNGGFNVKLVESAVLHRSDDKTQIELEVKLNDIPLSTHSKLIVADAKTPTRLALDIKAKVPSGGYTPGDYFGSVNLIFEPSSP